MIIFLGDIDFKSVSFTPVNKRGAMPNDSPEPPDGVHVKFEIEGYPDIIFRMPFDQKGLFENLKIEAPQTAQDVINATGENRLEHLCERWRKQGPGWLTKP